MANNSSNPLIPKVLEFSSSAQPHNVFENLALHTHDHAILLDSCCVGEYSYIAWDPLMIVTSQNTTIKVTHNNTTFVYSGNPWKELEQLIAKMQIPLTKNKKSTTEIGKTKSHPLEQGGFIGYLGYDLVRFLENIPTTAKNDLQTEDCYLILPKKILIFCHKKKTIKVVVLSDEKDKEIQEIIDAIQQVNIQTKKQTMKVQTKKCTSNFTYDSYIAAIQKAKQHLKEGNTYQIKISQRLEFKVQEHPWEIYKRLCTLNPSPYSAYLQFPTITLVSCSPEHLLKVENGTAITRPIGGTYPKTKNSIENKKLLAQFKADTKERAEHTMLIDLERNDLGRVCELGSVKVAELMTVEEYSHLYHLVTEIRGKLQKNATALDAMKAMFPGGTVTGCPKIRTMQLIDELEPTQRGPYTGSIGFLSFNNCCDFNIIIRTLIIKGGKGYVQVGGGIVADSDPETEYKETLWKAHALLEAAGVKQTGL